MAHSTFDTPPPPPSVFYPVLRYRDPDTALDWLANVFGFGKNAEYRAPDGTVLHAEMSMGEGVLMFGQAIDDDGMGRPGQSNVYAYVADVDAHYERAREAGAQVVRELADTGYGSREYTAHDFEGNIWTFGTYRPTAT